MPQAALPCAQPAEEMSIAMIAQSFNAASGITMCTTLKKIRPESREEVSMPQAALPCAQLAPNLPINSSSFVSMPQAALPCAQRW